MDKNYICQEALKGIESASKMELASYDPETKQNKTEFFEVTDIARQSAMDAIKRFQNSDSERELIYHGQDNVADYLYYLEIRDGKLTLVTETDYGMKMHHAYNKPEELLYRFNELEKKKLILTNGDEAKQNNKVR